MQDSQADTYIERCFEEKCLGLNDGEDYINQWREDKKIFCSYTAITGFDFQHYSMHDKSHSVAILNNITMVLGENRVEKLSASDLWLLLECAYSHDIGMSVTYEELCEIWEKEEFEEFVKRKLDAEFSDAKKSAVVYKKMNDLIQKKEELLKALDEEELEEYETEIDDIFEKKSWPVVCERYIMLLYTDYIRKLHPEKSKSFVLTYGSEDRKNIQSRMYGIVAEVDLMHGKDFKDIFTELHKTENGFEKEHMYPQFAAAMLRLGDLLDMDSNRFNIRMVKHMGVIPTESMLHMKKHKAITHLAYTDGVIEAEARVEAIEDNFEVCKTTNQWFQWLDQEVKDLICCWNQIVPEDLHGCRLGKCKLKIYCKDEIFDSSKENKFAVDPVRVYDMLIGNNIYKSRLDFIREYLQNALDASKMQLWLQIKNQKELWKTNTIDTITPYDIDRSLYEQYKIEVEAVIDWKKLTLELVFRDYGIGMEKECVSALSDVAGDSWKKRSRYAAEIPHMPLWLQPTGGFGIGVQSAFMMANAVEFVTRADSETMGRLVRLESRRRGGRVLEQTNKKAQKGTSVKIEVPLMEFLDAAMKDEKLDLKYMESNLYDKNEISKVVLQIIESYIVQTAKYALFPIKIKCGFENEKETGMGWAQDVNAETTFFLENIELKTVGNRWNIRFAVTENRIIVWDYADSTMVVCCVGADKKSHCYYKGIRISNEYVETADNYFMEIIYFGKNVADYLTVSRDSFQPKKRNLFREDVVKYKNRYAELLVHEISRCEKSLVFTEMAQNMLTFYGLKKLNLNKNQYEKILKIAPEEIAVRVIDFEVEEKIQTLLEQIEKNEELDIYIMMQENGILKKQWMKSKDFFDEMRKKPYIFYSCKENTEDFFSLQLKTFVKSLIEQKKMLDEGKEPEEFEYEKEEQMCWKILKNNQYVIIEEEVCRTLEQCIAPRYYVNLKDQERFVMRIACMDQEYRRNQRNTGKNGLSVQRFVQTKMKEVLEKDALFPLVLGCKGMEKEDEKIGLWVYQVFPNVGVFSLDEACMQEWKQEENMKYLILPITRQSWYYIEREKKENGKISKEKYDAFIKKEEDLNLFVDWVYKYQISEKRQKRFEIKAQYLQLLDSVFEWCLEK